MRSTKRFVTYFLLAAICALPLTQTACSPTEMAKQARRVSSGLKKALPYIEKYGISTTRITIGIDVADRLVIAPEKNDSAGALELTETLINEFNAIIDEDVIKIPDGKTRTIVLVGLEVANAALHFLADGISAEAAKVPVGDARSGAARQLGTVQQFRRKSSWRCRSSQSGRFMKMDYCKMHPDVSQIDTF